MPFKNIRIKMANGRTRMQRVKVLKSGKFKFVKNTTGRKRKKKNVTRRRTTKRRTTKRKTTRRRRTTRKTTRRRQRRSSGGLLS